MTAPSHGRSIANNSDMHYEVGQDIEENDLEKPEKSPGFYVIRGIVYLEGKHHEVRLHLLITILSNILFIFLLHRQN